MFMMNLEDLFAQLVLLKLTDTKNHENLFSI